MKKLIITLVFSMLSLAVVNAQDAAQFLINFGDDRATEVKDGDIYERFIGGDSRGYYLLRSKVDSTIFLDYYGSGLSRESGNSQLMMPIINGFQSTFVDMFYLDGKLLLFSMVDNVTNKVKTLHIQQVNQGGTVCSRSDTIGKLTPPNTGTKFNVELTNNRQNVFVYYHRSFQTYSDEPFFFKVYNSDMKCILNVRTQLPELEGDVFTVENTEIAANSRHIYMLLKISPDPKKAKSMKVIEYTYKLVDIDINANAQNLDKRGTIVASNPTIVDIKNRKYSLGNFYFAFDNDENVDIFGFLLKKGKSEINGVMHKKYSHSLKGFVPSNSKTADLVFSKLELAGFRDERMSKVYEETYDYHLLDIVHLSNGSSVFISEHSNHWVDTIFEPGTRLPIVNEYFKYNDLLLVYCNDKNEMKWTARIPKSQYSYNDGAMFSSAAIFAVGDRIFLCYNDNPKNVKPMSEGNFDGLQYKDVKSPSRSGVPVVVTIFPDGIKDAEGALMFSKQNKKFKIMPSLLQKYGNNYYIVSQKGTSVKLFEFTPK